MKKPVHQVIDLALKKKRILNDSILKYLIRAGLSAFFVGIGLMVAFKLAEGFHDIQSPVAPLMGSIFFGMALILIIYGGAELFTGNTMYFTMATLNKSTTVKDTLQNWVACYGGNLIGAIIFGLLIMFSGIFAHVGSSDFLMSLADTKMNDYTFSQLFFKGILCNIVVCLAVWIPMHVKGDGPKITVMLILVFAFVAAGFEHSVANMVTFSISLAVPHPETITIMGALNNLIPVTLGNIIGGGFFVGAVYYFLDLHSKGDKEPGQHLVLVKKRSGKSMYIQKHEDKA